MKSPEFNAEQKWRALDAYLGCAPLLVVDDSHVIGQSMVIERYLDNQSVWVGLEMGWDLLISRRRRLIDGALSGYQ